MVANGGTEGEGSKTKYATSLASREGQAQAALGENVMGRGPIGGNC